MSDRAYARLVLAVLFGALLLMCWAVLRVGGEHNPTHEWGRQFSDDMPEPVPYVTTQATCREVCAQRGQYARWSAREIPCVCSVSP